MCPSVCLSRFQSAAPAFWGAAWANLTGVHHALIAPRLRAPRHCCVGSAVNGTVFQHGRRLAAQAHYSATSHAVFSTQLSFGTGPHTHTDTDSDGSTPLTPPFIASI